MNKGLAEIIKQFGSFFHFGNFCVQMVKDKIKTVSPFCALHVECFKDCQDQIRHMKRAIGLILIAYYIVKGFKLTFIVGE